MSNEEFKKQQYLTLREEIRESKSRVHRLVIVAAILVPAAGFFADENPSIFASACIPFVILVLMLAFIVEQTAVIRAGRYLREHIEPDIQGIVGWEHWLESDRRIREVDTLFFITFLVIFFVFYVVAVGASITTTTAEGYGIDFYATVAAYALGALWFLIVLSRHWRFATTTKA